MDSIDYRDVLWDERNSVGDRLSDMFRRQREFMDMLRAHGKLPDYPLDLSTKRDQRHVKNCVWDAVEELAEATHHLRNKTHYVGDHAEYDRAAYKEELMDSFAFFMELLIFSDITEDEMYEEYCRKNALVKRRLEEGF